MNGKRLVELRQMAAVHPKSEWLDECLDEIERLRKVIKAFEDLASAYRLGRRPKETSLDIIGAYHDAEAAKGEGQ